MAFFSLYLLWSAQRLSIALLGLASQDHRSRCLHGPTTLDIYYINKKVLLKKKKSHHIRREGLEIYTLI